MPVWFRNIPLKAWTGRNHVEIWVSKDSLSDPGRSYEVNVRLGKPIDILSLKRNIVEDFATQVSYIKSTRTSLFGSSQMEEVEECPICGASMISSKFRLNIYGAQYNQCSNCSHYFIIKRPSKAALEKFYSSDTRYASTYTDKPIAQTRLQQVAMPKLEWTVEEYKRLYGQKPKSILDVGAGGGHFVYACKEFGIDAQGIELSEVSREFCRVNYGFDLEEVDFIKESASFLGVDIITFWGLIEHVPNPRNFLKTAYELLRGRETLAVVQVPRWDCLSTSIQRVFKDSVVRHLDPMGHINIFTDSSLATAFETSGFAPAAAWYFGMDAYEITMQLSLLLEENGRLVVENLGKHIPFLQNAIDQAELSDQIVIAAKPSAIVRRTDV